MCKFSGICVYTYIQYADVRMTFLDLDAEFVVVLYMYIVQYHVCSSITRARSRQVEPERA